MKPRIYIDTSVIGGCLDKEFSEWSIRLFEEFQQRSKIAVVSNLTRLELEKAPDDVKAVLSSVPESNIENVFLNEESEKLSISYIDAKIVTAKHIADAQHIAIASVERVDVLVSWNFKQIVNLDRIHVFNSVNIRYGYSMLEIRTPREIIYEKEI
jgi:predicted nucleic acid-binding protein